MGRTMDQIVLENEADLKRRFFKELAKMKKMVDDIWDQTSEPKYSWNDLERQFEELRFVRHGWMSCRALLEIKKDEDD